MNQPCEYQLTPCQKLATINHYLPNSNLTKSCWTCANCWELMVKHRAN